MYYTSMSWTVHSLYLSTISVAFRHNWTLLLLLWLPFKQYKGRPHVEKEEEEVTIRFLTY